MGPLALKTCLHGTKGTSPGYWTGSLAVKQCQVKGEVRNTHWIPLAQNTSDGLGSYLKQFGIRWLVQEINPHPSTCMGDPPKTYGTYIWWAYLLEENDMKWDPCLERNMFSIIKDISNISSKIQVLLVFRDRHNWILPGCRHLLYPQQLPL